MTDRQLNALSLRETDVAGALRRLCGNEALYCTCLNLFLEDPTVAELSAAIEAGHWDEAFTAAHALKGLAGNLGFIPLMHATGKLVVQIRGGRVHELSEGMEQVNSAYRDISDAIRKNFVPAAAGTRGETE